MENKTPSPDAPAAARVDTPREIRLPDCVERLLTMEEAAFALGIGARSVARLVASGDIEIVKIVKTVRIRPSALNRFIEAREVRLNPKRPRRKSKAAA